MHRKQNNKELQMVGRAHRASPGKLSRNSDLTGVSLRATAFLVISAKGHELAHQMIATAKKIDAPFMEYHIDGHTYH